MSACVCACGDADGAKRSAEGTAAEAAKGELAAKDEKRVASEARAGAGGHAASDGAARGAWGAAGRDSNLEWWGAAGTEGADHCGVAAAEGQTDRRGSTKP